MGRMATGPKSSAMMARAWRKARSSSGDGAWDACTEGAAGCAIPSWSGTASGRVDVEERGCSMVNLGAPGWERRMDGISTVQDALEASDPDGLDRYCCVGRASVSGNPEGKFGHSPDRTSPELG